jgi:hypothetical protein
MAEQPVNLSTVPCLGVFSRAEQPVLHALEYQQVNHAQCDRSSGRNRPSEKDRAPLFSVPNILTYGEAMMVPRAKATHNFRSSR